MAYIYILMASNGAYYVGSCENLNGRIIKHNRGQVPSTKRYVPWEIVYYEKCTTLIIAKRRELQIKRWRSRIAIERLISQSKILK